MRMVKVPKDRYLKVTSLLSRTYRYSLQNVGFVAIVSGLYYNFPINVGYEVYNGLYPRLLPVDITPYFQ